MYLLLLKIAFYGLFIGGGVGVIGLPISRKKEYTYWRSLSVAVRYFASRAGRGGYHRQWRLRVPLGDTKAMQTATPYFFFGFFFDCF